MCTQWPKKVCLLSNSIKIHQQHKQLMSTPLKMMIQKLLVITLTVLVITVSSSRSRYADAFAPSSSSSSLSAVSSSSTHRRSSRRQLSPFPTTGASTTDIYRVTTSSRNNGQTFGAAKTTMTTAMFMTADDESSSKSSDSNLPFWLDPNTRGGAIVLSLILFIVPFIAYSVATGLFGVDEVEAGKWIGVGFTAGASFLWVFTYIFRVATKDMTYVRSFPHTIRVWF